RNDLVNVLERIETEVLEDDAHFLLRLQQRLDVIEADLLDQARPEDLPDVDDVVDLGVGRQVRVHIARPGGTRQQCHGQTQTQNAVLQKHDRIPSSAEKTSARDGS